MSELPPDAIERNGQVIHQTPQTSADGATWVKERPVASTFAEAKAKKWDFYHPDLGWVLGGYKLQRDRSPESIMADGSQSVAVSTEQQDAEKEKANA